ncbi:hypothetical protein [Ectobacillus sp. sgz5001026]|uniref:hypothetical protein n=1 Tax=Ectobacillus sp. sgz5001026 TaxID=3242473 RepID=UPI0036D25B94
MMIEFDKLKQNFIAKKVKDCLREYPDYYEYCVIQEYENEYSEFQIHAIQLADVFVCLLEMQGKLTFVSIQFPRTEFHLSMVYSWLYDKAIYVSERKSTCGIISNGFQLIQKVLFKGHSIILYEKGNKNLSFDMEGCVEVSQVYDSYHQITTTTSDAVEVFPEEPSKVPIFLNGERIVSVPRIDFNMGEDLIVSNGHIMVADYIEDYCGTIGFFQQENPHLPISFPLDEQNPIYIDVIMRDDGSKVYVFEQKYTIQYEEL